MKPMPPEMLELVPNGIENLVLRCIVCTTPLPRSRRRFGTCLPERPCQKILTRFRRYCVGLTKCVACLNPSTPEEREDFKKWRRSRHELKANGRPKTAKST